MADEQQQGQENKNPDLIADESKVLTAEQAPQTPHVVFDEDTFTPPAPDASEVVKLETKKVVKEKTTKPPPPTPPKKSRETKTLSFTLAEFEYIDKIYQARKESGLNEDYNQFLRQCVDFAINHDAVKGKLFSVLSFARPDIPHQYLNNAFFNKKK